MQSGQTSALSPTSPTSRSQRRQQLWAYQRDLVERTRNAQGALDNKTSRLAVAAGGEYFLLDLTHVSEVLPPRALTAVPLTKPWFLGLANCRGNLIGVADLAGFLGKEMTSADKADRLLIFSAALSTHCAIRVARVIGLMDTASMTSQPVLPTATSWNSRRYLGADSAVWTELDLARIVTAPAFLNICL